MVVSIPRINLLFICACNFDLLMSFRNIRNITHSGAMSVFCQERSRSINGCLYAVTPSYDKIFGFTTLHASIISSFTSTVVQNCRLEYIFCPGLCIKIFKQKLSHTTHGMDHLLQFLT